MAASSFSSGRFWVRLRLAICSFAVIYLIAPLIVVLIISFSSAPFLTFPPPGFSLQWYNNLFTNPAWFNSLVTSIKILVPTSILATVLGTSAAYGLARSDFVGKQLVMGLLLSPMIVPVIIVAIGIFGVFRALGLYGNLLGLIIAHTILAIPYVVMTVSGSLAVIDKRLEDAALTLGASPLRCFRRITFPLIFPAVLSGMLFSMVVSFDELVVSMFISTPVVRPVTVQMWSNIRGSVDPTIAAIATLLFCFSLLALLSERAAARKIKKEVDE